MFTHLKITDMLKDKFKDRAMFWIEQKKDKKHWIGLNAYWVVSKDCYSHVKNLSAGLSGFFCLV